MGPTNLALVKLFQADQNLRAAQERYESAARSVRILERKVADLTGKLTALLDEGDEPGQRAPVPLLRGLHQLGRILLPRPDTHEVMTW